MKILHHQTRKDKECRKYYLLILEILLPLFIYSFLPVTSHAQTDTECDEVLLSVEVTSLGTKEMTSIICAEDAYLSVHEVFNFLQIKNQISNDLTEIDGFFINPANEYVINADLNQIMYKGEKIKLEDGSIITTKTNIFLQLKYFEKIFGLSSTFNYRRLAVNIHTDAELPSIKAARQKKLRENMNNLSKEFIADSTVERKRFLFKFGVLDWNLLSLQSNQEVNHSRFSTRLGAIVAGGELTAGIIYESQNKFSFRDQFLQWRYVNNDNIILRQTAVGRLALNPIASLFNPVLGVQLSNEPTVLKKSFGTYTFSDYTKPGWMVELYINNVLIDYTKADASGFFSFQIPIMYGNTEVDFRFYGPWGEEEISSRVFTIPYNFTSAKSFRYTFSTGIIENKENDLYAGLRTSYGVNRNITLGSGVEFISSIEDTPIIPYFNAAVRLPFNFLLSGRYMHEIGFSGNLNFSSRSDLRINLEYRRYEEDQKAVLGYLEERVAEFFFPVRSKYFTGISRFSVRQNFLKLNNFSTALWQLSGRSLGLNYNLTTEGFIGSLGDPQLYSKLSTTINIPANFIFSPYIEYNLIDQEIHSIRAQVRKKLFKDAVILATYNHNLKFDNIQFNLGFSFSTGFSRIGINSNINKKQMSVSESISGSAIIDPAQGYLHFDSRSVLGVGNIRFLPFLDLNNNLKKDPMEPLVENLNIFSASGGEREVTEKGIFFYRLEPYKNLYFEFNTQELQNISWRIENTSLNIAVNPNQIKLIEIPVSVVGEVSGYVVDEEGEGIGGIKIEIRNSQNDLVTTLLSEPDGYFSFLGLSSGKYSAQPSPAHLEQLGFSNVQRLTFEIENGIDGDIVDTLEFYLEN